jgi:hypothetical protein
MIVAASKVVERRLEEDWKLKRLRLPLGTEPNQPHVPVLHSEDLETNTEKLLILVPDLKVR